MLLASLTISLTDWTLQWEIFMFDQIFLVILSYQAPGYLLQNFGGWTGSSNYRQCENDESIFVCDNLLLLTSNHYWISSVVRVLDCRLRGHGFNFQGWTNTQGLKITEKWTENVLPLPCNGLTYAWLRWPRKTAVLSPQGDIKIVSSMNQYFRAKCIDTQIKYIFYWLAFCF